MLFIASLLSLGVCRLLLAKETFFVEGDVWTVSTTTDPKAPRSGALYDIDYMETAGLELKSWSREERCMEGQTIEYVAGYFIKEEVAGDRLYLYRDSQRNYFLDLRDKNLMKFKITDCDSNPISAFSSAGIAYQILLFCSQGDFLSTASINQDSKISSTLSFKPTSLKLSSPDKLDLKIVYDHGFNFIYTVPSPQYLTEPFQNSRVFFLKTLDPSQIEEIDLKSLAFEEDKSYNLRSLRYFNFSVEYPNRNASRGLLHLDFAGIASEEGKEVWKVYHCIVTGLLDAQHQIKDKLKCRELHQQDSDNGNSQLLGVFLRGRIRETEDSVENYVLSNTLRLDLAYSTFQSQTSTTSSYVSRVNFTIKFKPDGLREVDDWTKIQVMDVGGQFYYRQNSPNYKAVRLDNLAVAMYKNQKLKYLQLLHPNSSSTFGSDIFAYLDNFKQVVPGNPIFRDFIVLSNNCFKRFGDFTPAYFSVDTKVIKKPSISIPYFYRDYYGSLLTGSSLFEVNLIDKPTQIRWQTGVSLSGSAQSLVIGYHSLLRFDNNIIRGAFDKVELDSPPSDMHAVNTLVSRLTYYEVPETGSPKLLAGRMFGSEDIAINLDTGDIFFCETDQGEDLISFCKLHKKTNLFFDELQMGSMVLKDKFFIITKKSLQYRLTVIDMYEQSIFSTAKTLTVDDGVFFASFALNSFTKLWLAYNQDGYLMVEKYDLAGAGLKPVMNVNTTISGMAAISMRAVASGKVMSIVGVKGNTLYKFDNDDYQDHLRTGTFKLLAEPSTPFKKLCVAAIGKVYISDGVNLYYYDFDVEMIKIELHDSNPVDWIKCYDSQAVFLKKGKRIYQFDVNGEFKGVLKSRFDERKVFFADEDAFVYSTPGGWYMHRPSSSSKTSAVFELNDLGNQIFLKASPNNKRIDLKVSNLDQSSIDPLTIMYKTDHVESQGESFMLNVFKPLSSVNSSSKVQPIENYSRIIGHLLDINLKSGEKSVELKSMSRRLSDFKVPEGKVLIDYCRQGSLTAMIVRDQKDKGLKRVIVTSKNEEVAKEVLLSSDSGNYFTNLKVASSTVVKNRIYVSTLERSQDGTIGSIQVLTIELDKPGSTIKSQIPILPKSFRPDDLTVIGASRTVYVAYEKSVNGLLLGLEEDKSDPFNSIIEEGVFSYEILNRHPYVYLFVSHFGQTKLTFKRFDSSVKVLETLESDFNEMHYYDKFKCYLRSDQLVECIFAGRKIKIVTFKIEGTKLKTEGTPEEYHAYKNIRAEQVDFNENTVMIAGSRFAEMANDNTYDHSGIFLYNRLGSAGGSTYVRHLISKDKIFESLRSNTYKAVLDGTTIAVHGGYNSFVLLYEIGKYEIIGKRH